MRSLAASLGALAILAACERPADRVVERVAENVLEEKGRHSAVRIDRERGSIVVELGRAVKPPRWPSDVPFFDEARRAKAAPVDGDSQRLTISGGEDVASMERFYRERLAAEGWTVEGEGEVLRARRGGRELVARFEKRDPIRGARAILEVRSPGA